MACTNLPVLAPPVCPLGLKPSVIRIVLQRMLTQERVTIEMALLKPSKETQSELRWSTNLEQDDTEFTFYIPKFTVREPWPGPIFVGIHPFSGDASTFIPSDYSVERLEDPIRVLVEPVREHTHTVRYAPLAENKDRQIGEPYIPYSLVPPDSKLLVIDVRWDLHSKGEFVDVPTYREDLAL